MTVYSSVLIITTHNVHCVVLHPVPLSNEQPLYWQHFDTADCNPARFGLATIRVHVGLICEFAEHHHWQFYSRTISGANGEQRSHHNNIITNMQVCPTTEICLLMSAYSHSKDSRDRKPQPNAEQICITSIMASSSHQTHYEVLGINQEAKVNEVRDAYRKLALRYHPDKDPSNPQAVATFQKVSIRPIAERLMITD